MGPNNVVRDCPNWRGNKYLNFGEFLGITFEGKEDRAIKLLLDIEYDPKEVVGNRRGKVRIAIERELTRRHEGRGEHYLWCIRKGLGKEGGERRREGLRMGNRKNSS